MTATTCRRALRGSAFCRAHAALVDTWLQSLLGDEADVALVAVGGYGRAELAPGSDLDVLLVHRGRRDVAAVAQTIWYPIWDAGFSLDHSVKTVKEALGVASGDLKAAMGLLHARGVAGDRELAAELATKARDQWRKHRDRWLRALGESVAERHARMGDIAFLIEPDLKESRGGLRDINALRAAAIAVDFVPPVDVVLAAAENTVMTARVELHRLNQRGGDRVLLQDQDAVAASLGVSPEDLMQEIAAAARSIGWASDDTWRRVRDFLDGPRGRIGSADKLMSPGVVLRDRLVVEIGRAHV